MSAPQPPAPSKWAMDIVATLEQIAREYRTKENQIPCGLRIDLATRLGEAGHYVLHHAAAQAETVALLEEANDLLQSFTNGYAEESGKIVCSCCGGTPAMGCKHDCKVWLAISRLTTHLAQLKEGAP